jgi:glycerol-3-phosphate O-acyltransferase
MRGWKSAVLDDAAFERQIRSIAIESGRSIRDVRAEARDALEEMGGRRSPIAVYAFASLSRFVCRRGYDPDYCFDMQELDRTRQLAANKCIVYLITHKTYLDLFVLYDFLYRQGIATPYMFGGANMAFAGFGPLARRAGGIFIRRAFADQPLYKAVLDRYVKSLMENGCSFCWAIEGTRSRTGKLVAPKIGLLKYVANAAQSLDDAIAYVPVSVSYDLIPDVADIAAQEAGAEKKPESLEWFVRYVRRLGEGFGNIYIRFGKAIAFADTPDAPSMAELRDSVAPEVIGVQKLAFEVCYQVNEVTPATTTSLVLMALLCRTAARPEQIHEDVFALQHYLARRQSESLFDAPNREFDYDVDATLGVLLSKGIVQRDPEGGFCSIARERFLVALYYSNMAVHHFVIAAFTELGLLNMAHAKSNRGADAFQDEVLGLRDLFKFEFFFARKDTFGKQFIDDLRYLGEPVEDIFGLSRQHAADLLRRQPVLVSYGALSPFINAYSVVADCLVELGTAKVDDRPAFVARCQAESRKRRAGYPGFAPKALLNNGLLLAGNRDLLELAPDADRRRQAFADELRFISKQLDEIRAISG